MTRPTREKGFTLIELAVVLVIVGILIGSFIGTFVSRIEGTRRDNVQDELEVIKQALMAYAFTKDPPYLPCPDRTAVPDGDEDRVGANCLAIPGTGTFGVLPWNTLGLGYGDEWGSRYSYWVDADFSNNTGFDLTDTANGAVNTRVNDVSVIMASNAVAVVFSRGKNGLGGISTDGVARITIPVAGHSDEIENADADAIFISRAPTDEGAATTGGIFDDILIWVNAYELKAKMVETGILP